VGAAFPELSEEAKVRRENAVFSAQDGFERGYRFIHVFGGEAVECFGEFPLEGVEKPEVRNVCLWDPGAAVFEKGEVAVAEIDPLRETKQDGNGLRVVGREAGGHVRMGVEEGEAVLDVSLEEGAFELIQ
jgi:hypothetical protein